MSALPDRSTEAAKHLRTRTHTRSTPAFILLPTLLQFFNSICSCYSEYNMQDGARDPNKLRYLSKRVSSPRFERALPRCRARTPARARPIPRPNCAHIRPPLAPLDHESTRIDWRDLVGRDLGVTSWGVTSW